MSGRRSILLLCDDRKQHAPNVLHHIAAFRRHSSHDIHVFNPTRSDGRGAPDLDAFDVVVIHYTLVVTLDSYLPAPLRERIARFSGLKVQFIQDEYRWIDTITACMRDLGIDLLFTLVPEREVPKVYGGRLPGVETVTTLAGYVPEELVGRPTPPLEARPLDVGYRGRTLPYWLGRIGQEKAEIARGFLARAPRYGLRCDLGWSETDRLYGERWIRFLESCRATLGTESGATIADYDGSVERGVKEYLAAKPAASFEEVEREVLAPHEGNLDLRVISPRQFEAACLRTALVLFPGSYSGILETDRHYIPLAKDFSNMDEVAERLRDLPALQAMVDRTYDDLVASRRYALESFVREFDELLTARAPAGATARRRAAGGPRLRRPRVRPAVDRVYLFVCALAAWRLVARRPALRRIAVAWARSREARAAVEGQRLRDDLFKLALLLEARAGRLPAEEPFFVEAAYDEAARRLMFGSIRAEQGELPPADGDVPVERIRMSLQEGSLHEIVWNHAALGDRVFVPLPAGRKLEIYVGYHGLSGAHSFRALALLAPRFPDLVLEALGPLVRASAAQSRSRAAGAVRIR